MSTRGIHKSWLTVLLIRVMVLLGPLAAAVLPQAPVRIKGAQMVDLSWSGGSATSFDIYRDGARIASGITANAYTDNIGLKGGGSYSYRFAKQGILQTAQMLPELTSRPEREGGAD